MPQRIFILVLAAVSLVACDKNKKEDFDRSAMLNNMVNTVIAPSYNQMESSLDDLDTKANSFTANTDATNLNALKSSFVNAYTAFQQVKMLDFGPFMDYGVKASMNTYPTDTVQIGSNITNGSYTLGSLDNVDAIGFPAIDFLLYHTDESAIITEFLDVNRQTYLTDLTAKMKSEFALVMSGWSSHQAAFIAADGNDASSSTSLIFNEFVKDIELLKNAKIGIPAGQQTGGMTLPNYVEAYYSGISTDLALTNLTALKNVFNGGAGIGFDDYIKDVEDDETTVSLADNINNQFDICIQAVQDIGTPLSEKVDTNPTAVNTAFLEIKKLVTYGKTDMSSTLGLLITFQDNDGD
ncbi:imelysin family protein [Paracrocinitomix mangrovi]|uniref:imelysin family protein n=1 Tax=Paracrocinitomix mangrovi TaxID=2862509 RepID=UPI001C8D305E|nr:imelysin family protein [Paracrocinitomix mangrovi]UKN02072.1 imelysin family protein [Paracrocinitomix mangrovi]